MKIGTRLTVMLLAWITPLLALYMYFSIRESTHIYVEDLKRETYATARALQAALIPDIATDDWGSVKDALERIAEENVVAAIFTPDGDLRFALPGFPLQPALSREKIVAGVTGGSSEFMEARADRYWLCRELPLRDRNGRNFGILLVAQEWTDVRGDIHARVATSAIAALTVLIVIAGAILFAAHRYVAQPLGILSTRAVSFGSEGEHREVHGGDEVVFLSSEFRRLDSELRAARQHLLDENERKLELERQLRHSDKLATVGTLASGLAHEIGTPLNVIRGRAEHLVRYRNDPLKIGEGLEIIVSQIDRISRIVRMLLDLGGRRERPRVIRDGRQIVAGTVRLLETESARRNVKIDLSLGDSPLPVSCDADQLQQVFVNLCVNAFDAMPNGGGAITISAGLASNGNGRRARFSFEDSGFGIKSGNEERIFDPFFTTKEPGKGTGMGLAVSQAIVRDHEGEIRAEPSARGARFVVELPLAHSQDPTLL